MLSNTVQRCSRSYVNYMPDQVWTRLGGKGGRRGRREVGQKDGGGRSCCGKASQKGAHREEDGWGGRGREEQVREEVDRGTLGDPYPRTPLTQLHDAASAQVTVLGGSGT